MSKDDSQSSEISQTDQNLITSSDEVQSSDILLDNQASISSSDAIAHEIVTTSEDGSNQQTLYVAIQPPDGNHGDMSHDQPAVYLEVVESGNLSEQITSAGQVLEGQMILHQGKCVLINSEKHTHAEIYTVGEKFSTTVGQSSIQYAIMTIFKANYLSCKICTRELGCHIFMNSYPSKIMWCIIMNGGEMLAASADD